jgi:putative oxidoreductase
VQTDGSVGAPILRLTLAVVLFPHGAQKVLGWFGGPGLKVTLQYFTSAGIPLACRDTSCGDFVLLRS